MFVALALAPSLLTLVAVLSLVPWLVAWHRRRATRPLDVVPEDSWAEDLMRELDAPTRRMRPVRRRTAAHRVRPTVPTWVIVCTARRVPVVAHAETVPAG